MKVDRDQRLIPPQSGAAFAVARGERLRITSPEGEQVCDLTAFGWDDRAEWLSSGRTIDYGGSIHVTAGTTLYSNRSNPMLVMTEDSAGRHDFLLAPCSQEMFERLHGVAGHHPSCFENLVRALTPFGVPADAIPTTLNLFMHVVVDPVTGAIDIRVPSCRPGDHVELVAQMDLVVGVTACSSEQTNNGSFSPILVESCGVA